MMCDATGPTSSPPRVLRRSVRFETAITALRTLMSSNGGDGRVQRDVPVAAARGQRELLRILRGGQLQRRRVEAEVAVHVAVAGENLLRRRVGVGEALLDLDRVEVGGPEVRARVPVRVADELDLLARRVAGELTIGVVLDHVRPRCNLVLAVGRRVLGVELLRVVTRNRRTDRESEGADHPELARVGQLDLERLVVRTGDPRTCPAPWSASARPPPARRRSRRCP